MMRRVVIFLLSANDSQNKYTVNNRSNYDIKIINLFID